MEYNDIGELVTKWKSSRSSSCATSYGNGTTMCNSYCKGVTRHPAHNAAFTEATALRNSQSCISHTMLTTGAQENTTVPLDDGENRRERTEGNE